MWGKTKDVRCIVFIWKIQNNFLYKSRHIAASLGGGGGRGGKTGHNTTRIYLARFSRRPIHSKIKLKFAYPCSPLSPKTSHSLYASILLNQILKNTRFMIYWRWRGWGKHWKQKKNQENENTCIQNKYIKKNEMQYKHITNEQYNKIFTLKKLYVIT